MKRYANYHGSMNENNNGPWVDIADVYKLEDRLAEVTAERDAWKGIHDGQQQQVYRDIGKALGADMPRELVNEAARRRMAELAAESARLDWIESRRADCGRVKVIEITYYSDKTLREAIDEARSGEEC